MGVRIAFYKTTDGKSLVENFSRTFSDFREWILTENKKSITEYSERTISPAIESFLEQSENEINYIKEKIKNLNQDDIGIECISSVLNEIDEKSELIINLEI